MHKTQQNVLQHMKTVLQEQHLQETQWCIIQDFMEKVYLPSVEDRLAGVEGVKCVPRAIFEELRSAYNDNHHLKSGSFVLELFHSCKAQACSASECCHLCEHNPRRRCGDNFMHDKYPEDGPLQAKCGQTLMVVLKDKSTGKVAKFDGELIVSLMHSQQYDRSFQGQRPLCSMDYNRCIASVHEGGIAKLPADLKTTVSSISLYNCKRASYRLLVRTVPGANLPNPENIEACVSQSFMTLTKKGISIQKKDKPLITDDIENLEKMGRERTKKFKALSTHVQYSCLPKSIMTVKEFQRASAMINNNGMLKQQVLSVLKISDEDWGMMCEHALHAIEHDTNMRYWRPIEGSGLINMLFYKCNAAEIDLASGPIALLVGKKVILQSGWDSWQCAKANELNECAKACWWMRNHPRWGKLFFTMEQFKEDPSALAKHVAHRNLVEEELSSSLDKMSMEEKDLPALLGEIPPASGEMGMSLPWMGCGSLPQMDPSQYVSNPFSTPFSSISPPAPVELQPALPFSQPDFPLMEPLQGSPLHSPVMPGASTLPIPSQAHLQIPEPRFISEGHMLHEAVAEHCWEPYQVPDMSTGLPLDEAHPGHINPSEPQGLQTFSLESLMPIGDSMSWGNSKTWDSGLKALHEELFPSSGAGFEAAPILDKDGWR